MSEHGGKRPHGNATGLHLKGLRYFFADLRVLKSEPGPVILLYRDLHVS
jgi:hypothetical protein